MQEAQTDLSIVREVEFSYREPIRDRLAGATS